MVSSLYGPVHSWRFGWSLGVDPILIGSVCSFNCVYCQLGYIQTVTRERRVFIPTEKVMADAQEVISAGTVIDVVTFSGNGEPTLALNFGEMASGLKSAFGKPLHILTNSTTLEDASVRNDLQQFDEVCAKLDAVDDRNLRAVNRPAEGLDLESITGGLEVFRGEYHGILSLQVALMPHKLPDAEILSGKIRRLRPDKIYLNRPKRPYPDHWETGFRGDHTADSARATHEGRELPLLKPEALEKWAEPLKREFGVAVIFN